MEKKNRQPKGEEEMGTRKMNEGRRRRARRWKEGRRRRRGGLGVERGKKDGRVDGMGWDGMEWARARIAVVPGGNWLVREERAGLDTGKEQQPALSSQEP